MLIKLGMITAGISKGVGKANVERKQFFSIENFNFSNRPELDLIRRMRST